MKKVKSLKALVLSLMLCLAMGTTAFASEVSTQGQAAPNANKAVEVSDCGDLDVVPAYDDAVALADTIQYDAKRQQSLRQRRQSSFTMQMLSCRWEAGRMRIRQPMSFTVY